MPRLPETVDSQSDKRSGPPLCGEVLQKPKQWHSRLDGEIASFRHGQPRRALSRTRTRCHDCRAALTLAHYENGPGCDNRARDGEGRWCASA